MELNQHLVQQFLLWLSVSKMEETQYTAEISAPQSHCSITYTAKI